jgi:hypothetical protein
VTGTMMTCSIAYALCVQHDVCAMLHMHAPNFTVSQEVSGIKVGEHIWGSCKEMSGLGHVLQVPTARGPPRPTRTARTGWGAP